jgi:hypothetical protein
LATQTSTQKRKLPNLQSYLIKGSSNLFFWVWGEFPSALGKESRLDKIGNVKLADSTTSRFNDRQAILEQPSNIK